MIMIDRIIQEDVDNIIESINLSDLNNKEVLITGASGLIGTYLIFTMLRWNEVHKGNIQLKLVVRNELPNHLQGIKMERNVEICQGDLSDYTFCKGLPRADYIIHAAGYGQPVKFLDDKIKTIRINTMATDILLEKLKNHGKFLFVSSSEVYIGCNRLPYSEEDIGVTMPDHGRACYIEGKRCGEAICNIEREKGKDIKIARVTQTYGPGIRYGDKRVICSFIEKGMKGEIKLLDSGQAKRVCCYVTDTVENLLKILLEGKKNIYNVGGTSHATILELAHIVGEYLGAKVIVPDLGLGTVNAPAEVDLDIQRLKDEFRKNDYVEVVFGVQRTIEWYKRNYGHLINKG